MPLCLRHGGSCSHTVSHAPGYKSPELDTVAESPAPAMLHKAWAQGASENYLANEEQKKQSALQTSLEAYTAEVGEPVSWPSGGRLITLDLFHPGGALI